MSVTIMHAIVPAGKSLGGTSSLLHQLAEVADCGNGTDFVLDESHLSTLHGFAIPLFDDSDAKETVRHLIDLIERGHAVRVWGAW